MSQISNKVLVYVDAINIGSTGGINHLVNMLSGAPDKVSSSEIIYKVWAKPALLKKLPVKKNINYYSNIIGNMPSPFNLLWNLIVFRVICYFNKPDYLFCPGGNLFFSHPRSIGVFQNIHPFLPKQIKRSPLVQKIRLHLLLQTLIYSSKRFNKHIFHTKNSHKIMSDFFERNKHYKVIPHGVDNIFRVSKNTVIKRMQSLKEKINQNKKITYTYVSSAEAYKNHIKLIDSFNTLHDNNKNFELNLILSDGPSLPSILKKIDQCNFTNNINLYSNSNQEEVVDILHNKTDIGLFVSSCETFGLILVENMASGLPIFAIRESCIPEILGDNPFYFDIENPKSLYNELQYNFENFENFEKYSLLAWKKSNDYYWQRAVNDTWDFIFS
tara:strand:- start:6896 stop:8050 length:1155 start_codon:yes stop_codon:yes gene_type:complete